MKSAIIEALEEIADVAPYAGAWIEMLYSCLPAVISAVAPYAGAWIEILPVVLAVLLL